MLPASGLKTSGAPCDSHIPTIEGLLAALGTPICLIVHAVCEEKDKVAWRGDLRAIKHGAKSGNGYTVRKKEPSNTAQRF